MGVAGEGWTTSPRRARLLDPLGWRRHGLRATAAVLLVLGGIVFDLDAFGPAEPVLRLLPSAALSDGLRATLVL